MQENNRTKLVNKNIYASFAIKVWSAAIVYLMVPLTLKMLGIYLNGIWLTISSILVWIDMMDIGLGNGLRNALAQFMALGDLHKAREAVSSTLFMLILITVPILTILLMVVFWGDSYNILGINPSRLSCLNTTLCIAVVFVCMSFILKFIGNFYMGLQLPAINNMLLTLGQTIALAATYIAYLFGSHSLKTVVIINTSSPLLVWIFSYLYTFWKKYPELRPAIRFVNIKMSRELCSTGVKFFIIQTCSLVLFMSSNLIISNLLSPADVTPYQVAYRYFSIMLVIFTVVCMPFWNATTDAYVEGDLGWIRKASNKLNFMMAGITIGMIIMLIIAPTIYQFWVGSEVNIPQGLSISMACYLWIIILSMRYSYFLNGIGALRIQLIFTISATLLFLPLAWIGCRAIPNVSTLVTIMCLVNVPGLIANIWYFNRIIPKQ